MHKKTPYLHIPLKYKVIVFIFVLVLIFASMLFKTVHYRNDEFYLHNMKMAENSTKTVSFEIDKIILHKKQLIKTFFEDNEDIITSIVTNPDNYNTYELLNKKLERYFTDYFATNIIDDKGRLIIDEFEGSIGKLCLTDISDYLKSHKQLIRLHPNPIVFHYDIIYEFTINSKKYIFLVTFTVDEIVNLLNISKREHHSLFIINKKIKKLIEITDKASRQQLHNRQGIYLSNDEDNRIVSRSDITDTYWEVVDFYDKFLFKNYIYELLKQQILIFVVFLVLAIIMYIVIIIGLRKKEKLQNSLIKQNDIITALNKNLKQLATIDKLSGMYNRRYFDEMSHRKWNEAHRLKLPFNLAMIDIDFFKQYNDNYGHIKGDNCISLVARCIKDSFRRSNEFSARYGGEEFVIISIGDDTQTFFLRLEKLMLSIRDNKILHAKSTISEYVTVSIGFANTKNSTSLKLSNFINKADIALYEAKGNGRNQIVLAKN